MGEKITDYKENIKNGSVTISSKGASKSFPSLILELF
jgi:hypothetical protein